MAAQFARFGRYVPVAQRRPGQGTGTRGVRAGIGFEVNSEEFIKAVEQFGEEVAQKHADLVTLVALRMYADLIAETPRDTGYASAGWNIALDSADKRVPPPGSGFLVPGQTAAQRVTGLKVQLDAAKRIKKGENVSIYLSNHVDYIVFIMEDGTSRQAPPGTFTTIVTKWGAYAEKANESFLKGLAP